MIYLSLGSNIEPRLHYLKQAVQALEKLGQVQAVSTIHETEPLTLPNDSMPQAKYLNQVIALQTTLSPQELLSAVKGIERDLGRQPSKQRWQPREIDIDIILYHAEIIDSVETEDLTSLHIPHLGLPVRQFMLEPLAELAPDVVDPRSGKTIKKLFNELHEA